MDRRIVFVRHVSSPHPRGVSDFDRPIDESGREDGARMARHLESEGTFPRRVLCSEARRAKETLEAMLQAIDADEEQFEVELRRSLYSADIDTVTEAIWGLPDEVESVLLVGHNPVWSDAVGWLTDVRTKMPKGAAAVLTCAGEQWKDAVQRGSCELARFVRPAEL